VLITCLELVLSELGEQLVSLLVLSLLDRLILMNLITSNHTLALRSGGSGPTDPEAEGLRNKLAQVGSFARRCGKLGKVYYYWDNSTR